MSKKTLILFMAVMMAGAMALTSGSALAQTRGGIINWFIYADPARLDIHTETPLGVQQATAGIYSGLLQYSPDNPSKIVPDLA